MKAPAFSPASKLLLKCTRYIKCYRDLALGGRPETLEGIVDYCVDRPVLIGQVRSEILQLGKILEASPPKRTLEIGTNYGGTLLVWCTVSAPDAKIISIDLPKGPFGGGYPRRKIPLFRKFPRARQRLHLIRENSHSEKTRERVLRILGGEKLDYLFIDGDHTYIGLQKDFEMYASLVRTGGLIALHDIRTYDQKTNCDVERFWNDVKQHFRHREIIESENTEWPPTGVTGAIMETAGLGVLFMP